MIREFEAVLPYPDTVLEDADFAAEHFGIEQYLPPQLPPDVKAILSAAKANQKQRECMIKEQSVIPEAPPLQLSPDSFAFQEFAAEWPELFTTQQEGESRHVRFEQWADPDQKGYQIIRENDETIIHYHDLPSRNRALFQAAAEPELSMEFPCEQLLDQVDLSLDISRGGVYTPDFLKKITRWAAACGYHNIWLYQEYCEIEDDPDNPINRLVRETGMLTADEIREVVRYADEFGKSVQPMGQTLSHLEHVLELPEFQQYILQKKDPKTCSTEIINPDIPGAMEEVICPLVRNMLRPYLDGERKNVRKSGLNVGLDEAIGFPLERLGEYAQVIYRIVMNEAMQYGYTPENFTVSYWRDSRASPEESNSKPLPIEVLNQFPEQMNGFYWEYDATHEQTLREDIKKVYHTESNKISEDRKKPDAFATSTQKHFQLIPSLRALPNIEAHFRVARELGIREGILTNWGDEGDDCSLISTMPAFVHFASLAYDGDMAETERFFQKMLRVPMTDVTRLSDINYTTQRSKDYNKVRFPSNSGGTGVFEDPGLRHFSSPVRYIDFSRYYQKLEGEIGVTMTDVHPSLWSLFEQARTVADCIQAKQEFGKRLDNIRTCEDPDVNDTGYTLYSCAEMLDAAFGKLLETWFAHRRIWLEEKKPNGLERIDSRYANACKSFLELRQNILAGICIGEVALPSDSDFRSNLFPDARWNLDRVVRLKQETNSENIIVHFQPPKVI